MPTGTIYVYTELYQRLAVLYVECKWYEFVKKKIIKEEIGWIYPLYKGEQRFNHDTTGLTDKIDKEDK